MIRFDIGGLHSTDIRPGSTRTVNISSGSYPEFVNIGTHGQRGVWLEQSLRSDYVKIIRLDFFSRDTDSFVSMLVPSDPVLPFKPSACLAMAFDETIGRVCFAVQNGSVHMLDYL